MYAVAALLPLLRSVPAQAVPGDLDTSFAGGIVTTSFGPNDGAYAVALAADGRIVVAGGASLFTPSSFSLARFNPDGQLDPSFGDDGQVTTDFSTGYDQVNELLIQPDGKIIAAGFAFDAGLATRRVALARYLVDGSLDSTFGAGGTAMYSFGTTDWAEAAVLQSDGKIVIAGATKAGDPSFNSLVARFNTDGSLDTTFGGGAGFVSLGFGSGILTTDQANAIAIAPDGKIVIGGSANTGSGPSVGNGYVARLSAAGPIDPSFAGAGVMFTAFGGTEGAISGVVIQPDGRIVAVGSVGSFLAGDFGIARFTTSGSVDAAFGTSGIVTTDFGGDDRATGVAYQLNGELIVSGTGGAAHDFAVARYQATGALDPGFGFLGQATANVGGSLDAAEDVAVQNDGAIVVAGATGSLLTDRRFVLARFVDEPHAVTVEIANGTVTLTQMGSLVGTMVFNDFPASPFGTPVNLGTSVGSTSITIDTPPPNLLTGMTSAPLVSTLVGHYRCNTFACGALSFTLDMTSVSGGGLPAGYDYVIEGDLSLIQSPFVGPFRMYARAPANTPVGANVTVNGPYSTVSFANVTSPGTTTVRLLDGPVYPWPSSNFAIFAFGSPQAWQLDISTTAGFSGPITICFPPAPDAYFLFHRLPDGSWETPAEATQPDGSKCFTVTSLSPFVLAIPAPISSGFVPPDTDTAKCGKKLGRFAATLAKGLVKCGRRAAAAAVAGRAFDLTACEAGARAKYDDALAGLTGCPACMSANGVEVRDAIASLVALVQSNTYCAGTTALGSGFALAPTDATIQRCESGVAGEAKDLVRALLRCQAKLAKASVTGRPFDPAACIADARGAYDTATLALSGCPVCSAAGVGPARDLIDTTVARGLGELIYCAGSTPF